MKLLDGGRAPNPRRVRIFLAEKGIDIPMEPIDMGELGHKSEAVTKHNHLQRLPVLVLDDGTSLTESVAICRYFEELHPDPPLMGVDALDKARVEMWQRRMELNLLMFVANTFRHAHPAMAGWEVPQIKEFSEANRPKAQNTLLCLKQRQLIGAQEDVYIAVGVETHTQFDAVAIGEPIMRLGDAGFGMRNALRGAS